MFNRAERYNKFSLPTAAFSYYNPTAKALLSMHLSISDLGRTFWCEFAKNADGLALQSHVEHVEGMSITPYIDKARNRFETRRATFEDYKKLFQFFLEQKVIDEQTKNNLLCDIKFPISKKDIIENILEIAKNNVAAAQAKALLFAEHLEEYDGIWALANYHYEQGDPLKAAELLQRIPQGNEYFHDATSSMLRGILPKLLNAQNALSNEIDRLAKENAELKAKLARSSAGLFDRDNQKPIEACDDIARGMGKQLGHY